MSHPSGWLVAVKPTDVALTRLAARQYSLAHRQQALDLGLTPRQRQTRVESGWLVPVHRNVYRLAGGHCTDELRRIDVSQRRRIPVTAPARTLLDLGSVAPHDVVESALEDALLRRLVTFELLTGTLSRLAGPGRRGAAVLRALVAERDPATAPTQSALEDELMRVLRRGGLPEPVRQYEVAGVRLDAAYPHVRFGIEADSRIWHGGRLDVQRNSDKANLLMARGWRVLRVTWFDLKRRWRQVVGAVAGELVVACPA